MKTSCWQRMMTKSLQYHSRYPDYSKLTCWAGSLNTSISFFFFFPFLIVLKLIKGEGEKQWKKQIRFMVMPNFFMQEFCSNFTMKSLKFWGGATLSYNPPENFFKTSYCMYILQFLKKILDFKISSWPASPKNKSRPYKKNWTTNGWVKKKNSS